MKGKKNWILTAIAVLAMVLAAGLYNRLTVTEYTVQSEKIETAVKIVLLTDLHSCDYGEGQEELIEAIDKQTPEYPAFPDF